MSRAITIYSDVDGVLTTPFKTYDGQRFSKQYSDRDAYAINVLKPWLVLISQDPTNRAWAEHKGIEFVHANTDSSEGKFKALCDHWYSERKGKTVEWSDPDNPPDDVYNILRPDYIYIGDSPYDWDCLKNARYGFIPLDGSTILKRQASTVDYVHILNRQGGCGCLEEFLELMMTRFWKELFPKLNPLSDLLKQALEKR